MEPFKLLPLIIFLNALFLWSPSFPQGFDASYQVRWTYVPAHVLFSPSVRVVGYERGKFLFLCRGFAGGVASSGRLDVGPEIICRVVGNNGEVITRPAGRFQVLFHPLAGSTWIPFNANTKLPPNAVISGYNDGSIEYVCRGWYVDPEGNKVLIPGKYVTTSKHCLVVIDPENTHSSKEGEILAVTTVGHELGTIQIPDDRPEQYAHDVPIGDVPQTTTTTTTTTARTTTITTPRPPSFTSPKTTKTKKPVKTRRPKPSVEPPTTERETFDY